MFYVYDLLNLRYYFGNGLFCFYFLNVGVGIREVIAFV